MKQKFNCSTHHKVKVQEEEKGILTQNYLCQNINRISPATTYRIQLIWQDLTENNLKKLESTKARFIERILYVLTRLAYTLA
jgi:hypothetical protein